MADCSQKKKVVANGLFKAEIDEFLRRELAEDGYSGVEVRKSMRKFEIIISATRTQQVLGEKSRRIRELTSVVAKRFNYEDHAVEVSFAVLVTCTMIHLIYHVTIYTNSTIIQSLNLSL